MKTSERSNADAMRSLMEQREMELLGLHLPAAPRDPATIVPRFAISAPKVLNEAFQYASPVSFTRGLRIPLGEVTLLMLSGTASIGDQGESLYRGDFRAQTWRTFRNLTTLLEAEGADWHDVVRTSCYLRDIERDYDAFNEIRNRFYQHRGLDPLPASTGIQARLCREDLLIEIELIAMVKTKGGCQCGAEKRP
jgi:2-iminobutanoate/2-iminopropanoate deaminase